MGGFKKFILRLLQVMWVLAGMIFVISMLRSAYEYSLDLELAKITIVIISITMMTLTIIQYLVLSSYKFTDLFDGTLSRGSESKFSLSGTAISIILLFSLILISGWFGEKKIFKDKMIDGTDSYYFNSLIRQHADQKGREYCKLIEGNEKPSFKETVKETDIEKSKGYQGYAIIYNLTQRDDKVGYAVTCAFYKYNLDVDEMVEILKLNQVNKTDVLS